MNKGWYNNGSKTSLCLSDKNSLEDLSGSVCVCVCVCVWFKSPSMNENYISSVPVLVALFWTQWTWLKSCDFTFKSNLWDHFNHSPVFSYHTWGNFFFNEENTETYEDESKSFC